MQFNTCKYIPIWGYLHTCIKYTAGLYSEVQNQIKNAIWGKMYTRTYVHVYPILWGCAKFNETLKKKKKSNRVCVSRTAKVPFSNGLPPH